MRFFDKEYFDLLTTSPGNYIFKNKSNKSEFGKLTSILHILLSIIILIYNLYSYYKGSGMNLIYSKKSIKTLEINKNDDYIIYTEKKKIMKFIYHVIMLIYQVQKFKKKLKLKYMIFFFQKK